MDKIWLKSYPPGVPATIDVDEFPNVGALFAHSVSEFGERAAFINMGSRLTYRELDEKSRQFAAYLQQCLGLPRGARVALMMPNLLQYPVCLLGALRAGYTVVNVNPLYTAPELAHQLKDAGAQAIVILENFAHTLEAVLPEVGLQHVVVTRVGEMLKIPRRWLVDAVVRWVKRAVPVWHIPQAVRFSEALKQGAARSLQPVEVGHQDLAFLQYTGGTTGLAKGAMLSHGNILANLAQAHAWLRPFLSQGPELVITALPLYHVFALTANCLTFMKLGATNVLITNPRDIPGFVCELRRHRFTVLTGVNTLFNALLNNPRFCRLDFSDLHITLGGGMAVQSTVAQRWRQVTGKPLFEAYGLTETSPAVAINPLNLTEFSGSIGLPVPSTEVAILDDAGHDVPLGEQGELCVRGPQVMQGYFNRPDETAKVMTDDGYLRTGDIAVMDDKGFLYVVDRKKDMIVVSGFKVFPNEVEAVIAMMPGVLEVAVIGVPDVRSGEAVKALIVKRDPQLTHDDVIAHCHANLTQYKVPHQIEFRTELPKSNVGKILRRALRGGN